MNYLKRRSFLGKIVPSMAAFSFFPLMRIFAKPSADKTGHGKGTFAHIVFFWLKNPDDPTVRRKFEQELKKLTNNIDSIVATHIGTPASTNRDVIDNSYTYNLLLTFTNEKDQDIYQEHPVHLKFIENAGDLWEKVVVYDSVGI